MSVFQQCEPHLHDSGGAQDGKGHLTLTTEHQQKPEAPQVAPLWGHGGAVCVWAPHPIWAITGKATCFCDFIPSVTAHTSSPELTGILTDRWIESFSFLLCSLSHHNTPAQPFCQSLSFPYYWWTWLPRYNSIKSSLTRSEESILFQQRNLATNTEMLMFILAASHSAANDSSVGPEVTV